MNNKPYLIAIGAIFALGIVLLLASGPHQPVNSSPRDTWTLTFSIPASNLPAASRVKTKP